jgi:hypothetical protein
MLNPILYSPIQPARIQGEVFLLSRTGVSCNIKTEGFPELSASGQLVLTTQRIVFVPTKKQALGGGMFFESFELPLTSMSNEKFNQPIFGANNLTGTVQPVSGGGLPGPASFKITFKEGGCGTFLHFFIRALKEIRSSPEYRTLGVAAASGLLQSQAAAFVDPNDPTVIFLAQPVGIPVAGSNGTPYSGPIAHAVVVPAPDNNNNNNNSSAIPIPTATVVTNNNSMNGKNDGNTTL